MIEMNSTKQFADSLHGTIYYSGIEGAFIGTPAFNRLHNVLQSSLAYLTYLSNKVKRFEHSIGTMKLSGDIFYHSICNTLSEETIDNFLAEIKKQIENWLRSQEFLKFPSPETFRIYKTKDINDWEIPTSSLYNIYTPANIKTNKVIYLITFQAIRLCGLLHDIGHLPFSHLLEHCLKDLYLEINSKKNKNDKEKFYTDIIKKYINQKKLDKPIEIHEKVGIKLFNHIIDNIYSFRSNKSDPEWMFFEATCFVAQKILNSDEHNCPTIFKDLHLIVSGIIDADRLDYCNRDLSAAGIKHCATNYERLFAGYTLIEKSEKNISQKGKTKEIQHFYFSPNVKNIDELENLINLRWTDFSSINFHHRVHKHEILLEEVLKRLAKKYFEDEREQISYFDSNTIDLPLKISSIWELLHSLDEGSAIEHLLIQMDDNWLNTLLKKEFFTIYGTSYISNDNANTYEWNQFHELVSAQRHYFSLIKRNDDFIKIDRMLSEKIYAAILEKNISISDLPKYKNKDFLLMYFIEIENNESTDRHSNIYSLITQSKGYVFNQLINRFSTQASAKLLFCIEQKLNEQFESDKTSRISNVIIQKSQFGLGYSIATEKVYVHSNDNHELNIMLLAERSQQLADLQKRQFQSPYFHVYFLPKYDKENLHYLQVDRDLLKKNITECIFQEVSNELFSENSS